ncbi:thioredoxin family protein [Maribacter sp. HTCC2170]|uniref:thioredoxin family protein n=1 Tax=Maribacter sp. (strain HTCC2170 / KCCM 42371) TaxID=313603 RepID=UPI00006BD4F7|nr:thioredoxin family protein [Maribacter sp. HTCC2170]EAR02559.1 hypothetical protein FB2170_04710 [Maribacter sp. HTCC2170]
MTHNKLIVHILTFLFGVFSISQLVAQNDEKVNWITFEELDDSLAIKPKKVFINFYADWCTPCHKMDQSTYKNTEVITTLNKEYYAVRMNVETNDTINFGNKTYINKNKNRPNPLHQIPLLMAARKDKAFSLPAIVLLNEKFEATARYFQYMDSSQLLSIL